LAAFGVSLDSDAAGAVDVDVGLGDETEVETDDVDVAEDVDAGVDVVETASMLVTVVVIGRHVYLSFFGGIKSKKFLLKICTKRSL
jgi:hypothetical protein